MSKPWLQALETQAELMNWLANDEGFRTFQNPYRWLRSVLNLLSKSSCFWVSTEVFEVISQAADALPDDAQVSRDEIVMPYGFIVLEAPESGGLRAISWSKAAGDLVSNPKLSAEFWASVGWFAVQDCDQTYSHLPANQLVPSNYIHLSHYADIPYPDGSYDDPTLSVHAGTKWLKAFWLFVQQRLLVESRERPDRKTAKRLAKLPELPTEDVRVIQLRRQAFSGGGSDGEAMPVDWSHRWIVGGHWRKQYLPSTNDHRLTWIAPYVKGPDDKPLVVKKNVFSVVR